MSILDRSLFALALTLTVGIAAAAAAAPTESGPTPTAASSATSGAPPALRLSLEIDPADYTIYHGWGAFVGIRPAATGRWRFRIGGGAATLPDFAVQNNDNNDGWKERLDPVITLAAHRAFGSGRGGFFAGAIAGWSSITFTAPSGGEVDVRNLFAGIDLGYRWYPFDSLGLMVTPHLGAIVPVWKSTEPTVGMETYDLLPVIPLPQILVGWECDVLE